MALLRMQDRDEAKDVLARIMLLPLDQAFFQKIAPYLAQAPKDVDDDDDDDG